MTSLSSPQNKQTSALRFTCLAATIMLLLQTALGYWVSAVVEVPADRKGSGILDAIGRGLADGPISVTIHVATALLLIVTAISVIIRAIRAGRLAVLAISVVGLLAILAANVTGAQFFDTGDETDMTVMAVAGLTALVCYLVCLGLLGSGRSAR
jgi:uncharacterized Tic20 family protein